ncbi:MAG: 4-hydroxythreonine-4-phosphate dehydrogenase PdxA, partial [Nocardioidaceae bacterium]
VVRVSVDHGTAFDIAGSGSAREASLVLATRRAAELAPGWSRVWEVARPDGSASSGQRSS